ncbi:unnamed protein product [Oikopleura dioica]|uniref:Uncharacterized protein n=1 Tax=Oikopleura dioica TaxID=34765 RepID=E4XQA4_OIKDI|nr:unnamed protein product [Oikopleura dioica]
MSVSLRRQSNSARSRKLTRRKWRARRKRRRAASSLTEKSQFRFSYRETIQFM